MSGLEFVPSDFNLGRGQTCALSDIGENDNIGTPIKSKSTNMFSSNFSKVMFLLSIVLSVVMVYMYIHKKGKQPSNTAIPSTDHQAVLDGTSKEDLQRMLENPDNIPKKESNLSDQLKHVRENILQEFAVLVEISPNSIIDLSLDKAHMIIKAKQVYENVHRHEDTFPSQSQILTLMYAKKILIDCKPPAPAPAAPAPALMKTDVSNETITELQNIDSPPKSVAFNLDNIDSDDDK